MTSALQFITRLIGGRMENMEQQLAELQSQPRLQPVTPEAIKKLEEQHGYVTFFKRSRSVRCIYSPSQKCWWDDENVAVISPHAWDWFIDLSTIPEVQQ